MGEGETWTEVARLLAENRPEEALAVALEFRRMNPRETGLTWYRIAQCLMRAGRPEEAVAELESALERGEIWRNRALSDPAFDRVRDDLRFRRVEREAGARIAALGLKPRLDVYPPTTVRGAAPPLVLGLHGASSTAADFARPWLPATAAGFLLAVPQSSQPAGPGIFCWDDPELAEREVAELTAVLARQHDFDTGRVVLAGFSQGAALAFRLAQRAILFDALRLLLAAPSITNPPVDAERARHLRAAVILGDQDPYARGFPPFRERAEAAGMEFRVEVVQGMHHAYPDDFGDRLPRLLEWLLA